MNLDIIIPAAIAAIPTTIFAAAAFIQALRTHLAVNSRMTEMIELVKKSAGDAATLAEKDAEHVRKGEAAALELKKESHG